MALVTFICPPFVFSCRGGDIIFLFTIWTLLQGLNLVQGDPLSDTGPHLFIIIERDPQGKGNAESKAALAENATSHQPDKPPSLPPATMLPLKSKRKVGMTNSSLYPPKINHSTELEWDTDFSSVKGWVGGWYMETFWKGARWPEQGIAEQTPRPDPSMKAGLLGGAAVIRGIRWHRWNLIRYWICIDPFSRSLIHSFTQVSVLQRPSQITRV